MRVSARLPQVLTGLPFLWLGYEAAADPGGRVALAEAIGVPNPEAAVRLNGALMVAGGAALIFDKAPRLAAVGLAASLVPTTIAGHAFWRHDDPVQRTTQRIQVLKNIGLVGGLLAVALRGGDGPSSARPCARRHAAAGPADAAS